MNTSQHKVLKQNQSIDIPNGTNSPSLSASLSSMRISGDLGTPQIENQNNAVQNNNSQVPNATQSNFEEHILLYNVLQQLTRKVQERDQLNEVLEQENVKLKYMLMTALNYCYDTIGNTQQKNEGANNFEYPRRNSNTDPNYSSSRMNVSSSNNSSRKGSTDDHQSSPRPDSRRDSQGMNISPRQQAEMMGMPIAQESSPQYDMLSSRRRSSNTVNTNPQYQQLETYVMGRKPSVEYHEPPQQQPSYEMPTHPERRRLSNNTSYGLENYVMPTTPQRSSQPQMQPQQQQQDVYGDLQNYVMKKANPHAYQPAMPEVYHDEPIPSPAPRRSSAVPLENYVMPTSTSAQQSPYHNLDNYVMGGVQPQIQPQEPYRRSSVQVPQYIPSPTTHQQQSIPQQWQQQQQHPMDHQSQPYQVKERKRSTSNGTDYPLENYPTARPHVYTPKTPVPQQEKFFNMNDQYRRASLAFPPSSRHNQRQMGEPVQRSVDMFNENFMFPQQQQQQQQPPKRMSNPVYMHENFVFPQQQPPMDFANYRMTSANDYSPKVTSKKKKDRGDERRQSYGSQQQQQLQPSMPQQPYGSQQPPQQQQLQTPPPQSQLTSPDKVFGGDASVIPARRSSVIYTPGPSPKELRQQQQQKEKERQQQLLQQQQQKQEEKVDSVSTVEDCETYVSDDVSPVGNGQQQNQIVDDNASFVTYFSDSD